MAEVVLCFVFRNTTTRAISQSIKYLVTIVQKRYCAARPLLTPCGEKHCAPVSPATQVASVSYKGCTTAAQYAPHATTTSVRHCPNFYTTFLIQSFIAIVINNRLIDPRLHEFLPTFRSPYPVIPFIMACVI